MTVTLCTGLLRSGSTWSYNIVRLLHNHFGELQKLPQQSPVFASGQEIDEYLRQHAELQGYTVIKVHFPGPYTIGLIECGVLKTVTTYRDPRDCVVSLRNLHRSTTKAAVAWVERNLEYFDIYRSAQKNLFLRYDDVVSRPVDTAKKIADFLTMGASAELLRQICQETDLKRARNIQEKLEKQSTGLNLARWLGWFSQRFRRPHIDEKTRIQTGTCRTLGQDDGETSYPADKPEI